MRKIEDWYLEISAVYRDELRAMKKETPLIAYEMTRDELDVAYRTARRVIWEEQIKLWKSFFILVMILFIGMFLFFIMLSPDSVTPIIEACFVIIGICMIPVLLMSLVQSRRVKRNPLVYVSASGAYFLGKLYPFRGTNGALVAALFIEGDGVDPSVLRLNFGTKAESTLETTDDINEKLAAREDPSELTLEIPLRQEHIDKIEDIIKSLMSDLTQ